jgi:hypothetical protein
MDEPVAKVVQSGRSNGRFIFQDDVTAVLEVSSDTRRASFRDGIFRPDNRRASARAPTVPESPRGDASLKVPRSRNPDGDALLCCAHPTAAQLASGGCRRLRRRSVVRPPMLVRAPSVVYVLRHPPREAGRRTSRPLGLPTGRPRDPQEAWCWHFRRVMATGRCRYPSESDRLPYGRRVCVHIVVAGCHRLV